MTSQPLPDERFREVSAYDILGNPESIRFQAYNNLSICARTWAEIEEYVVRNKLYKEALSDQPRKAAYPNSVGFGSFGTRASGEVSYSVSFGSSGCSHDPWGHKVISRSILDGPRLERRSLWGSHRRLPFLAGYKSRI
jgi:hypothetical protein